MKKEWQQKDFSVFTLDGEPDTPGDPVLQAVITKPGVDCGISLDVNVADFPFIGASYKDDELEKAMADGQLVVEKFWPSQEAATAMLKLAAEAEGVEPFETEEEPQE
jgi:hypothetical protein